MPPCPQCNSDVDADDSFCHACGAPVAAEASPAAAVSDPDPEPRLRAVAIAAVIVLAVPLYLMFGSGKGCSRVEGTLVSSGSPLGDFTFTPAQCHSGDRLNFYGVVLVGATHTAGGLLVAKDPAQGTFLTLEVPGTCQLPDYEVCTEVVIKREQCRHWDVDVRSSVDIADEPRVMHGHARAECAFPGGGSFKVDLAFESCN